MTTTTTMMMMMMMMMLVPHRDQVSDQVDGAGGGLRSQV